MKLLTNLFFLLCMSVFCRVDAQDNKKLAIEIEDIVLPDHPNALLKAKISDRDNYEITLRYQPEDVSVKDSAANQTGYSVKYIVRPFTPENFCRILDLAISKLEGQLNKNGQSLAYQSNSPKKDSAYEKAKTRECRELFYQLKGSEIATVGQSETQPIAGTLHFSNKVFIQKTTTNELYKLLNKREHDSNINSIRDSIISNWKSIDSLNKWNKIDTLNKIKRWAEDSTKLMSKAVKESIENIANLKKNQNDDVLSDRIFKLFSENLRKKEDLKALNKKLEEQNKLRGEMYASFLNFVDIIINTRIKDTAILTKLKKYFLVSSETSLDSITISKITDTVILKMIHLDSMENLIDQKNFDKVKNGEKVQSFSWLKAELAKRKELDGLQDTLKRYVILADEAAKSWASVLEIKQNIKSLNDEIKQLDGFKIQSLERRKSFEFKIKSVQIEFNEGFIENILIVGEVETWDLSKLSSLRNKILHDEDIENDALKELFISKTIKFENTFPIGFSRKKDYVLLSNITLSSQSEKNGDSYTLDLRDLFTIYIQTHVVGRRDFSPKNCIVNYDPKDGKPSVILMKEETSKLFEARIYSDFVGLDGKAANGLLQTEVAKRLNLNTRRRGNWCWISWVEPILTLSKIEQNNKNLLLNKVNFIDSSKKSPYYASTLDIRQHEAFRVGIRFNVGYLDFPDIKSTLSLNGNVRFGRTPVSFLTIDTSENNGVNTFTLSPELTLETKADERWGLLLSIRTNRMKILSKEVVQVANITDPQNLFASNAWNKVYNSAQFQVFFKPSEDNRGQLFFRYRYHWQWGDFKLGFHQAQVGYSFYLLGRNKMTPNKS